MGGGECFVCTVPILLHTMRKALKLAFFWQLTSLLAKLAVPKRGYRTEKWLLAYFFAQPESFSDKDDINLGCSPTNVKLKGESGGVEAAGVREISGKSNKSFSPPRRV